MCGEYGQARGFSYRRRPVHPHMCGEYAACRRRAVSRPRFTPTCVGSTASMLILGLAISGSPPHVWGVRPATLGRNDICPVHPHMCGEYFGFDPALGRHLWFTPTCVGSTGGITMQTHHLKRFTPTCVGSTAAERVFQGSYPGSPPHVWGVRQPHRPRRREPRFTPTCVGSTAVVAFATYQGGRFTPTCVGSTDRHAVYARFTPTCVGSTLPSIRLQSCFY